MRKYLEIRKGVICVACFIIIGVGLVYIFYRPVIDDLITGSIYILASLISLIVIFSKGKVIK